MKRTRIRPVSQKRLDARPERQAVREAVFARDGGCLLHPSRPLNQDGRDWGPCLGEPFTFHHLQKSGQCGPYTEDNGVTLCSTHNSMVEDWPLVAACIGLVVSGHRKIRGCA